MTTNPSSGELAAWIWTYRHGWASTTVSASVLDSPLVERQLRPRSSDPKMAGYEQFLGAADQRRSASTRAATPWSIVHDVPPPGFPAPAMLEELAAGFPFRMLGVRHLLAPVILTPTGAPAAGPGGIVPLSPGHPQLFLWWPGVIANTVAGLGFGLAVAGLWPWLIRVRDIARASRGLCPACRYPVEPRMKHCPECGREL